MNRICIVLFAISALGSLNANAQCWNAAQTAVDSCNVTASGSATARALNSRFADIVNVKDYGATGNGTTSDQTAITSAIAATSGVVYFPPGTYLITAPIQVFKPVVLIGSGSASIIKAIDCNVTWPHTLTNTFPLIAIRPSGTSFSDVTVSRLTLDGNCATRSYGGSEWNAGVEVAALGTAAPSNVHLTELHIKDVAGDGITVRGDPTTTAHSTVPSNIFIDNNFVERWHSNRQGVAVVAGSRVTISNNQTILGIPTSGTCPASTSGSTDPTNGNFGIDIETTAADSGDFVAQTQISSNTVHDCNGGINISNSNYPSNAISTITVNDNIVAAYNGLPLKPLQVNGSGISGYVEYNNRNDDGFRIFQNAFRFWSDGTLASSKGAFLSSTGVWTNASSRDYKQDIQPYDDPLPLLRQVQVYQYRYRADHGDDGRSHLGVIAEELPEAVASADHKGAPTGELIALSLAVNRALLKRLELQEIQLKALSKKVEHLQGAHKSIDNSSTGISKTKL